MAKSKRPNSRNYTQVVYSEKRKIFVERYLTPKGKRLLRDKLITKQEADEKYGKNKYRINPNAKPLHSINHIIY